MSQNLYGSLFMTLSMFGFTSSDALIKHSGTWLSLSQILFFRGIVAVFLLTIIVLIRKELFVSIKKSQRRFLLLRVLGEVGATLFFFTALLNMKISNAVAILQCLPLALAFFGAFIFRETVGVKRWLTILAGFFGVLLIIKPTSTDFNSYSLMALVAVFFLVLRDLSTRKLDVSIPSTFVSLITASTVTIIGMIMYPFQPWVNPPLEIVGLLSGAGIFLVIGVIFNVLSVRTGDISFVSPFRYTSIFIAIFYGVVFYNEIPDIFMIIGTLIVIVAGSYLFYAERQETRN